MFGSYFLTGEHRPYSRSRGTFGRVKPLENFWWVESCDKSRSHGSGAWELAARFSMFDMIDDGLAATSVGNVGGAVGRLNNYTLGVNWYWNPYMRVMFNYVHSDLRDIAGNEADTDAFLSRFQIDF